MNLTVRQILYVENNACSAFILFHEGNKNYDIIFSDEKIANKSRIRNFKLNVFRLYQLSNFNIAETFNNENTIKIAERDIKINELIKKAKNYKAFSFIEYNYLNYNFKKIDQFNKLNKDQWDPFINNTISNGIKTFYNLLFTEELLIANKNIQDNFKKTDQSVTFRELVIIIAEHYANLNDLIYEWYALRNLLHAVPFIFSKKYLDALKEFYPIDFWLQKYFRSGICSFLNGYEDWEIMNVVMYYNRNSWYNYESTFGSKNKNYFEYNLFVPDYYNDKIINFFRADKKTKISFDPKNKKSTEYVYFNNILSYNTGRGFKYFALYKTENYIPLQKQYTEIVLKAFKIFMNNLMIKNVFKKFFISTNYLIKRNYRKLVPFVFYPSKEGKKPKYYDKRNAKIILLTFKQISSIGFEEEYVNNNKREKMKLLRKNIERKTYEAIQNSL